MLEQEDYRLKYLKYKKKYLDLQSKIGAGFPVGHVRKMQQDTIKRQKQRREREEQENSRRLAQERFNALPAEEKERILQERRIIEEEANAKKQAEYQESLRIKKQNDRNYAESLIKQINDLHSNTINAQCGFKGCRTISSNIKKIKKLLDEIKLIDNEIANSVISKLNESTDKQKKCNCITLF